jgi:hypothetical protein
LASLAKITLQRLFDAVEEAKSDVYRRKFYLQNEIEGFK